MEHIVGFIAAFLTTFCFVPQALKVYMTKDTESISLWMYALFTTGVSFWLYYGLLLGNYPIIIANIITLILASLILGMKIRNELKKRKNRQ